MFADPARLQLALEWTARLVALAVSLQCIELLQSRRHFSDTGIWRYPVLAREHARLWWPLRTLLSGSLRYRRFVGLLGVQLGAAVGMLVLGQPLPAPLLLCGALLICVRFRGTFNGGSDMMTVLILLALSIAACAPERSALQAACLGYIAVQSTLSYAMAGLSKLKEPDWRNGRALQQLLESRKYALPARLRALLGSRARLRMASVLVLGFECCFALAWLDRWLCAALLGAGALFHLANARWLGLNRFFFAWLASYPALLYFAGGR